MSGVIFRALNYFKVIFMRQGYGSSGFFFSHHLIFSKKTFRKTKPWTGLKFTDMQYTVAWYAATRCALIGQPKTVTVHAHCAAIAAGALSDLDPWTTCLLSGALAPSTPTLPTYKIEERGRRKMPSIWIKEINQR